MRFQIAGVITGLKVAKSKRSGEMYAQASLEDTVGKIELIAFPQSYEKLAEKLKIDVPVLVTGRSARRRGFRSEACHLQHSGAGRCEAQAAGFAADQSSAA